MTIHLIKLSVGSESVDDLEQWQRRSREWMHVTRNTPKKAAELLDGGSIYWVIKGWVCGRQKLLELRPLDIGGVPHCGLVYAPEMIRVQPRPHRPFQGWRYLQPKDAPPDIKAGEGDDIPDDIRRELISLGLL
ncbi:MAG: DUF1489 family protein [Alphaproteobacteria bacterium]|nr:DUF1489 family protein [Alphaproteobacteria bacterium]